jgi:hypothetical protein
VTASLDQPAGTASTNDYSCRAMLRSCASTSLCNFSVFTAQTHLFLVDNHWTKEGTRRVLARSADSDAAATSSPIPHPLRHPASPPNCAKLCGISHRSDGNQLGARSITAYVEQQTQNLASPMQLSRPTSIGGDHFNQPRRRLLPCDTLIKRLLVRVCLFGSFLNRPTV